MRPHPLIFKVLRAAAVLPVTYFLAESLIKSLYGLLDAINAETYGMPFLESLAYLAITTIGIMFSISAVFGGVGGLAVAYISYLLVEGTRSYLWSPSPYAVVYLPLMKVYALIAGMILYVVSDVLAMTYRKESNSEVKTSVKGVLLLGIFEFIKVAVPVALALIIFGVYTSILSLRLRASLGVVLFWDILTATLGGRIILFALIVGIGTYLIKSIMEAITDFVLPSRLRAESYVKNALTSMSRRLIAGLPSKTVVGWMAFMGSLVMYPFILMVVKDIVGGYVVPSTTVHEAVEGLIILAITYIVMWVLIRNALTPKSGWKPLALLGSITAFLVVYSQVKYNLLASVIFGGQETPLDSEILNSYYMMYDQVVRLLRYFLYVLGVVP